MTINDILQNLRTQTTPGMPKKVEEKKTEEIIDSPQINSDDFIDKANLFYAISSAGSWGHGSGSYSDRFKEMALYSFEKAFEQLGGLSADFISYDDLVAKARQLFKEGSKEIERSVRRDVDESKKHAFRDTRDYLSKFAWLPIPEVDHREL